MGNSTITSSHFIQAFNVIKIWPMSVILMNSSQNIPRPLGFQTQVFMSRNLSFTYLNIFKCILFSILATPIIQH